MKRYASLLAAAALVLLADAFALIHARNNLAGPFDADLTLSEAELYWSRDPDDSGVIVKLQEHYGYARNPVIDRDTLAALGFNVSVDPASPDAYQHYQSQPQRRAWIVVELHDAHPVDERGNVLESASRLGPVDAGVDPKALRAKYPDRGRYIILPGHVRANLRPEYKFPKYKPAAVEGYAWDYLPAIHVPLPWSGIFRAHQNDRSPKYRVRLRTGAHYEPYVTGVEFLP